MATVTISGGATFPEGTSVSAYPRSAWGVESTSGAPTGSPAAGPVTVTGGVVTFTGLADGTSYIAYGNSRTKSFSTPVVPVTVGSELAFLEKTDADFATSVNGTAQDVTGALLTVTIDGSRPFVVTVKGNVQRSVATDYGYVILLRVDTAAQVDYSQVVISTANSTIPFSLFRRFSLPAGTYQFKVQALNVASGLTRVLAGTTHPLSMQAVLV